MFAGHWQFLLLLAVVVVLFGPRLMRLFRRLVSGGASPGRFAAPPARGGVHCTHCGAANPPGAKYCCACGRPLDFIDV